MKRVTVKIILDTRRRKTNGLYPAKLRITYDGVQKYYPTGKEYTKEDFERIQGPKPRDTYKNEFNYLDTIQSRAKTILDNIPVFSFDIFESALGGGNTSANSTDVYESFNSAAQRLKLADRISTANGYYSAAASLKAFRSKLQFIDVTPDFLEAYQKYMERKGMSRATVGIYLRYLRTLYNSAIDDGVIGRNFYPFGKKKFVIPTDTNEPCPLSLDDIKKLQEYQPADDNEAEARDFWVFSYVSNGMNPKDILSLKYKNIDFKSGKIRFVRSKTSRTQAVDTVPLHPYALDVIERCGNTEKNPEAYVFPFFTDEMTATEVHKRKNAAVRKWNTFIQRVCSKVGIENAQDITTYSARDSYANNMRLLGAGIELISEALGHSDARTTKAYLAKFSDDAHRRYSDNLLPATDYSEQSEQE